MIGSFNFIVFSVSNFLTQDAASVGKNFLEKLLVTNLITLDSIISNTEEDMECHTNSELSKSTRQRLQLI